MKELKLCAGEADGLAVYADGLVVEVELESAKGEEVLSQTRLDDIDDIVAQTLAVSDDVVVEGAEGIAVGMAVDFADSLCLEAVTQGVDVALNVLRGIDAEVFAASADDNHHLRQGLVREA